MPGHWRCLWVCLSTMFLCQTLFAAVSGSSLLDAEASDFGDSLSTGEPNWKPWRAWSQIHVEYLRLHAAIALSHPAISLFKFRPSEWSRKSLAIQTHFRLRTSLK